MPMNTQQFLNLYTKKIDKAFFEAYDEIPEQWAQYLNDRNSDQHNETVQRFAGVGRWQVKAELANPKEQQFKLADLIITNHTPYAIEVVMSREQVDDSRYNEVENMARDAGHGARDEVEFHSASVLDNAFDGTNYPIYDGKALCASDHPNRGDNGGTQSNLASGALTDANLKAGIILFRQQKDENGKKIYARPKKLIVNQALQFTAASILQSALQSGTTNNDTNTLPSLQLVDLDFNSSTTAWFLQGQRHQLQHYWRTPIEFKRRPYMEGNGSWVWDGYFRDSTAVEDWRNFVGSPGT